MSETRAPARDAGVTLARPMLLLAALVTASAIVRSILAWGHSVPRYFPDEYIYASLGRSIATGHLAVDGHRALFPALVEPVLAAPLWGLFSVQTAYHLVQVENAVAASLAAIPVYAIGRRLRLDSTYCLLCGLYAVVTPTLVMIPLTLTDFIAYPIALTALLCGYRALESPTRSWQLLFVGAAGLATLARTEYFVLVPAYIAAAALLDRRRVLRRHLVALASVAPVVVALVVAGTGYFSVTVHSIPFKAADISQIALQLFLMTLVAGVVIVPGAVVAMWRPPDRAAAAFGALSAIFCLLLVSEIGVFSVGGTAKFRERYLFVIAPVLALGYGLYLKRRAPHRWGVFLISVGIAIAASRIPVSAYSTGAARFDSQTLIALEWIQKRSGAASTAFVAAGLLTIGGAIALLVALRRRDLLALPLAIGLVGAMSVIATRAEIRSTENVRKELPSDLQWIDRTARSPVTAVATPLSDPLSLMLQLYWNPGVKRILLLDDAYEPESYAGPRIGVVGAGNLPVPPGYFLFDAEGTQATFQNARLVSERKHEQLWYAGQQPRLRTLIEGIWPDGWLVSGGRMRAWHHGAARGGVQLEFTASLPEGWPEPATLRLNGHRWRIRPGKATRFLCSGIDGLSVPYTSPSAYFDSTGRALSVQLTKIRASDVDARALRAHTGCRPV